MALKARIESPQLRGWVIGGLMLGLLGLSLAAAAGLSASRDPFRRVEVGEFRLDVPRAWQREDADAAFGWFATTAAFVDPEPPSDRLFIGRFSTPQDTDTMDALDRIANWAIPQFTSGPIQPLEQARPIAARELTGYRFTAISQGPNALHEHYIAVLQYDARRYWLIYLRGQVPARFFAQSQITVLQKGWLFDRMVETAAVEGTLPEVPREPNANQVPPAVQAEPQAATQPATPSTTPAPATGPFSPESPDPRPETPPSASDRESTP